MTDPELPSPEPEATPEPTPIPNGAAIVYAFRHASQSRLRTEWGGIAHRNPYTLEHAVLLTWGPALSVVWLPRQDGGRMDIMRTAEISLPEDKEHGGAYKLYDEAQRLAEEKNKAEKAKWDDMCEQMQAEADRTGRPVRYKIPSEYYSWSHSATFAPERVKTFYPANPRPEPETAPEPEPESRPFDSAALGHAGSELLEQLKTESAAQAAKVTPWWKRKVIP